MFVCIICHFRVTLDDVAVESVSGRPICLSCYGKLTETLRPMPRVLRREIEACLHAGAT